VKSWIEERSGNWEIAQEIFLQSGHEVAHNEVLLLCKI
jgi:hypothetical protein